MVGSLVPRPITVLALLDDLARQDVRVSLRGDGLVCSAPDGVLTDELRALIASRKPEIVAALRSAGRPADEPLRLLRAPRDQPLPLSFAQQRLWFLHRLDPADPVYNLTVDVPLPESPDIPALNAALRALARRHDVLRTVFRDPDGVPVQVITDVLPTVRVIDALGPDAQSRADAAHDLAHQEARRPFDLESAPAFRATLVRSDLGARLVLVLHHILGDGWSLGIIVRELAALYAAARAGSRAELPDLRWQYADYAYSARARFERADQRAHEAYWSTKLRGNLAPLELPADHALPRDSGSHGAVHEFQFPPRLARALRALSVESRVTLFATLFGAFQILLHRYTGRGSIMIGTPIADRTLPELEPLVGLFLNTVVLRGDLSDDPTVRTLLVRSRDEVLEANDHADYPFEKIVDLVRPERSLTHSPIFQTSMVLHNTPGGGSYRTISAGAVFDLSLFVWDGAEGLPACFEYNRNRYEPETIARMAGHLVTLAEGMVADPDRPISTLPLLSDVETHRVLEEWNDTAVNFGAFEPIHGAVEAQARRTPAATAVRCGNETLTYGALDEAATRLAQELVRCGVGTDRYVGICLERSIEFVVAILAVLKAGGAYVPIDPSFPDARIAFMIRDAGLTAVVTREAFADRLGGPDCPVVALDRDRPDGEPHPAGHRPPPARPRNAAYALYTSGSTGRPKGTIIEHGALWNYICWMRATFPLAPGESVLHTTRFIFDVSVRELFWPLASGAEVTLAPAEALGDPGALANLIVDSDAVAVRFVPPLLAHFLDEPGFGRCRSLRWILSGGEAMPDTLRARFFARCDEIDLHPALVNTYGPTETTINASAWPCDRKARGTTVPIGRPIANVRLYVLDEHRRPVPIGVPGELYVGGAAVGRGYLAHAALTAERFVHDPFSTDPAARLYRTGDRVRWLPEGVLAFLGRLDHQVKIRGFRIEPAEIESALWTLPEVAAAAVVPQADGHGGLRLVAYLVPRDTDRTSTGALREKLARQLPDYLIPDAFVWLDALPLTDNGKLDRSALPAPGAAAAPAGVRIPPANALEATIAEIWAGLLGMESVGVEDNFFDLGGHSLLMIQLQRKLRSATGCELPIADLFHHQTVRAIAGHVAALGGNETGPARASHAPPSCAVAIQPEGTLPPLFIVPGLSGELVSYGALAREFGRKRPLYGLRSVGIDGEAEPLVRVEEIATRFLADVRRIQPNGPYHLTGVCIGGIVAYEMAQQLVAQDEQVALLAMVETWSPTTHRKGQHRSPAVARAAFLADGIARRLREFRKRSFRGKIRYMRDVFRVAAEIGRSGDVYRGDRFEQARHLVMLRNRYAAAHYHPRPYPGRLAIVLSREGTVPEPDPRLIWKDLAAETLPIVEIAARDSGQALQMPHVARLAAALEGWMEQLSVAAAEPAV